MDQGRKRTLEVLRELLVDNGGEVTSVVEDHVKRLATLEASNGLLDAPVVLLLSLTLPGKDGDTSSSDAIFSSV